MKQVARNLTDVSDGFLLNSQYLIMDRDTKYTKEFRDSLDREGVKPVRCPVHRQKVVAALANQARQTPAASGPRTERRESGFVLR